ncbi:MAG: hypothetical protein FVQ79_00160 [Planctomycetes bacterium]|nr:hypothetical protein [Planctomycetota bacterium]
MDKTTLVMSERDSLSAKALMIKLTQSQFILSELIPDPMAMITNFDILVTAWEFHVKSSNYLISLMLSGLDKEAKKEFDDIRAVIKEKLEENPTQGELCDWMQNLLEQHTGELVTRFPNVQTHIN